MSDPIGPAWRLGQMLMSRTGFLIALDILSNAKEPLSLREIGRRMLAERGVTRPKEDDIRLVADLIKNTLDRYDGKAVQSYGFKRHRRWSVK